MAANNEGRLIELVKSVVHAAQPIQHDEPSGAFDLRLSALEQVEVELLEAETPSVDAVLARLIAELSL